MASVQKAITATIACLIAATACAGPNYFPQFSVLRLQSNDVARDLMLLDQAAAQAGFSVRPNNVPFMYDGRREVSIRIYANPNECCFRMSLSKWDEQPVLELVVSDSGTYDIGLRASNCEIYEQFLVALRPHIAKQQILSERRPCPNLP